ncbi:hypothetical protein MKW98_022442 [Papaver atlanticum]|uniref:O-fucosyltransferase family protein n=1 Tax=Papaver atlanticum TaxID=357466 RepID=A0AAD4S061_9MAGN|nr:hypothetical protein MKW98_022442 [Papaver atlanticum]
MAKSKNNMAKSIITINPFRYIHSLSKSSANSSPKSLLFTPRKTSSASRNHQSLCSLSYLYLYFLFALTFFTIFEASNVTSFKPITDHYSIPLPCSSSSPYSISFSSSRSTLMVSSNEKNEDNTVRLSSSVVVPLPAHGVPSSSNVTEEEREFWKQPNGGGYKPCLEFSIDYRRLSKDIVKEKTRFLVVVASGGLNQQRNQIVDAVVLARILKASLVIPILKVNLIWGDESEFSDIFDVEHFKRTLQADVRVVSSLPSTHIIARQLPEAKIPHGVSPVWIRSRFFKQLNEEGVLVLKGLDSKLSKNLPPDLQKLRCKVAFHALKFAAPVLELGNRLARRMWIEGPYVAVHLRLEKDVWIRTGCRTGLGSKFDDIIVKERESRPEFLTGRLNMSATQRRLAGLCPLNAHEVARLLKGLGAPRSALVYSAGGEPFGGKLALQPLTTEFPNLMTKEMLAREGELSPFMNRSSALAAIDYIVSLSSDVFLASHGGNMGSAMQGHRAYVGHRKYVKPNKRKMIPYFDQETSISDSHEEFSGVMRYLHRGLQGQPLSRNNKRGRDVIAYPVPECMCRR